ncbi:hypothetical protein IM876_15645 [Serratia plymuthica]|uniref:hypothetical protein n=1 Tax=Serratia plymuthica TaxID=82996 RepID=UPI001928D0A1|nr:hypothetical protein [Serratia plymuthica]MBL3524112.1 hypothetical protein [Serratia plymuthica]
MSNIPLQEIEELEDGTQIIRYGKSIVTKYPDGTMIIEQAGHKATTYNDGTIEVEMNGGHKSVVKTGSIVLTLNYQAIKKVHPADIANVVAVTTRNQGLDVIKEVEFSNGGTLTCHYNPLGDIKSISVVKINSFTINADGSVISFDTSDNGQNVTIH